MDEVLQTAGYKALIESKSSPHLSSESRVGIDDIQTYCHELRCRKSPEAFADYLREQFVFEMMLGQLETLLLEEQSLVALNSPPRESESASPEGTTPTKTTSARRRVPSNPGNMLWKPFYLDQSDGSRGRKCVKEPIEKTAETVLATHILQLWLSLLETCTKMNVSAVYFDDVKAHILDPRFSLIVERWLSEPTVEHIALHKELCSALVALIIYLHNHPFFDSVCFLRPVAPNTQPIQTCLTSFFHVIASLPKQHELAQHFSQWCMDIKYVRPDQPLPSPKGEYQVTMESLKFSSYNYGSSYFECVKRKHPDLSIVVLPGSMRRLNQELVSLPDNLPVHEDSMIAVRVDEDHPHNLSVLITGPRKTPYDSGCFQFRLVVPGNYPQSPPAVQFMTTGKGSVRFSPNLYECGKVCLSLLGTWQGDPWNPVTSTILQVLVSIQGAILGAEFPYYNEPGRERQWGSTQALHAERTAENGGLEPIRLGTVAYAWTDAIQNPPVGFENLVHEHFWLKRKYLLETMHLWLTEGLVSDTPMFYDTLRGRIMKCVDALTALVTSRASENELIDFTSAVANLQAKFPPAGLSSTAQA
ncbi:hypothetical protein LEN26_012318 [Aphanomyces euteiches]|nr:hypothetical protein LEN26_012318 [Aphanomyces euteiches]KAH9121727.1 hypothetical protein AeMF1_006675 [Aphanomyces euteiches]KAH9180911.1 hypothetical protein AeNC1_017114 [Aphanomyces euteiches]